MTKEIEQAAREAFPRLYVAATTARPGETVSVDAEDLQAVLNVLGPPPPAEEKAAQE